MTTLETAGKAEHVAQGHVRLRHVVASEWTKLRTVRSTMWTLLLTAAAGVGLSALVTSTTASRWAERTAAERANFDPVRASLAGLLFAQLAIGVLGVLVISAEYSSGTIRASLAAAPRRLLVLAAKIIVFGGLTLAVAEATSVTAFLLGQQTLHGHTPTASLADPTVVRAVACGGLYVTALGLLALGIGTILRHTAAAISTFTGALFILPIISAVLPTSLADDVDRYLPATIGTVMMSVHYHGSDPYGPWASFLILVGYAAAALTAGAIALVRRDA